MATLVPQEPHLTQAQRLVLGQLARLPDDTVISPIPHPSGFLLLNPMSGMLIVVVAGGQVNVTGSGFHLPESAMPVDLFEAAGKTGDAVVANLKQTGLPRGSSYPIPVLAVLPETRLADAGPAAAACACLCADHLEHLHAMVSRSYVATPLPPGWFAVAATHCVEAIAHASSAGNHSVEGSGDDPQIFGASVLGSASKVRSAMAGERQSGPDLRQLHRFLSSAGAVPRKIAYNRTRYINTDPSVITARMKVEATLGQLYCDPAKVRSDIEGRMVRGQEPPRLAGLITLSPKKFGELTPHPAIPSEARLLAGFQELSKCLDKARQKAELQHPAEGD